MLFADDQLLIAQEYDDLDYMTRKLIEECELWGLKLNNKKIKYMAIRDTLRFTTRRQEGDNNSCNECTYLGVRITKDGNQEPESKCRINRGRAAIKKLNSILWDRDVTPKTKSRIYQSIVRSTITYAAETWFLKAKTLAKLNFTQTAFWRRPARISRNDKFGNTVIKQKMNTVKSLLDDIKTKQVQCYGHVQRIEEGRLRKQVTKWRPPGRTKRCGPKLTWAEGIRGLMGKWD